MSVQHKATQQQRQQIILSKVQRFKTSHPHEYNAAKKKVAMLNSGKRDKFAEIKEADTLDRHLLELPETLFNELRMIFPDFLESKEERKWFVNRFKDFRVTSSY